MQDISDKLIVALDVDTLAKAKHFVDVLYPKVKLFKIGSQLFTAYGPKAVKMVGEKGAKVFLDLKFNDISNTVFASVTSGTALSCRLVSQRIGSFAEDVKAAVQYPVFMMTVHTGGVDRSVLEAAVRGASQRAAELKIKKPLIVGVTVLTSVSKTEATAGEVLKRARSAKEAGLDGVVCSVDETNVIRQEFGKDFVIVTPGIRHKGADLGDQKRVATAKDAIAAGADFIVVGRPILEAKDPLKAVEELI